MRTNSEMTYPQDLLSILILFYLFILLIICSYIINCISQHIKDDVPQPQSFIKFLSLKPITTDNIVLFIYNHYPAIVELDI